MIRKFDFLVIGSGIAGMSFALKVAHKRNSSPSICKAGLEEANTYFAQGGIASVTNLAVDNFDKHIEDTMIAGDWISDRAAVEKVVRNAPGQISELIKWGVNFDKKDNGEFDLHKEGGHSEFRILHHKDNTGAEIQESLIEAVKQHPNITVFTNFFAVEIITQHHLGIIVTRYTPGIKCYGAYVLNENTGEVDTFLSKVTIMATGGCEAVYRNTTNPLVATGDGIAMVYRAKGAVKDMEFIQFPPPPPLYHPGDRPLLPDNGSHARLRRRAPYHGRQGIHAEVRPASFTRPARHRGTCHRQRDEEPWRRPCISGRHPQRSRRNKETLPQYLREMS